MNASFVLRMTWDSGSQHWRILLRPSDGEDVRLFSNLESTSLNLETLMAEQVQKQNNQGLDPRSI